MAWHRFNQVDDHLAQVDLEVHRWENVMPGDIVQSNGTIGHTIEDFPYRNTSNVQFTKFFSSPMLVIARIPGIPGEPDVDNDEVVTFVVLTRHGFRIILGNLTLRAKAR